MNFITDATIYCIYEETHTINNQEIKARKGYLANNKNQQNIENAIYWAKRWSKNHIKVPYTGESFKAIILDCTGRDQSGYTYRVLCKLKEYNVIVEMKSMEMIDILKHSNILKGGIIDTECILVKKNSNTIPIVVNGGYYNKINEEKKVKDKLGKVGKIKTKDMIVGNVYQNINSLEKFVFLGKVKETEYRPNGVILDTITGYGFMNLWGEEEPNSIIKIQTSLTVHSDLGKYKYLSSNSFDDLLENINIDSEKRGLRNWQKKEFKYELLK